MTVLYQEVFLLRLFMCLCVSNIFHCFQQPLQHAAKNLQKNICVICVLYNFVTSAIILGLDHNISVASHDLSLSVLGYKIKSHVS